MKAVTLYRPTILESALSNFDQYLDSFFEDGFLSPSERIFNRPPAVDVRETEKAYVIEAELPGFDEKDIEIRLNGNNLSIESKKTEEKKEESSLKAENFLIRERRISSFGRAFRLPGNADPNGISASFNNGILLLEISKKAEAQAKVIQITKN